MSEVMEQSSALATIDTINLAVVYATENGIESTLARIEREAREQAAKLDISTERNRKAIRSVANKVARSKTAMDDAGAGVKAEWLAKSNGIDAQRRTVRSRLDALKAEILAPVEEYEAAIAARLQANDGAISAMDALIVGLSDLTPADINERRAQLKVVAEFDWLPEFVAKAERTRAGVAAQLMVGLQEATQREIDAKAEAERLAAEAEHQRVAAIEAQRVREEQIAREAAETARVAAEAKAARAAEVAAEALAEVKRKADHDTEVARHVAERAETARVEAHQAALESMRKLAAPLEHPDPAVVIDAKLAQLDDVYARDWEEFKPQAEATYIEHTAALQDARVESVRLAEEAAQRKRAAEEMAEAKRQAAAIEADRARVAEAQRMADAAAAKRAENVAHRRGINQAVVKALMAAGLTEEDAVAVVTVVAKGLVPHMTIGY